MVCFFLFLPLFFVVESFVSFYVPFLLKKLLKVVKKTIYFVDIHNFF